MVQGVLRTSASSLGTPFKTQFLLLSSSLAREWWQIDTDLHLLCIITSTAGELSGSTIIDDLEPQNRSF